MTYSIVARDPSSGELGVAVQSRRFGTGAAVPCARAGVGAMANQAFMVGTKGHLGLRLLESGASPSQVIDELVSDDSYREHRQIGLVSTDGRTAVHLGEACVREAGGLAIDDLCVQGNMLSSKDVVAAVAEGFARTEGTLAERLLRALDMGEAAGGDFRGRQAAGLLIVPGTPGDPWSNVTYNVRVDDHVDPLGELRRLYRIAAGLRRLNEIGPGASADEEMEAAHEAGLSPSDVALAGALAHAHAGDVAAAAAQLRPFADADYRWRDFIGRAVGTGQLPRSVLDHLG